MAWDDGCTDLGKIPRDSGPTKTWGCLMVSRQNMREIDANIAWKYETM